MHGEVCVCVAVSMRVSESERKCRCVHEKVCMCVCGVCVGVSISEHARTSVRRYVYESIYTGMDMSVCMCVKECP